MTTRSSWMHCWIHTETRLNFSGGQETRCVRMVSAIQYTHLSSIAVINTLLMRHMFAAGLAAWLKRTWGSFEAECDDICQRLNRRLERLDILSTLIHRNVLHLEM